jgi:acyl-coenzyme A synthetase/AMP-(fatty) acid ligase
MTTTTPSRSAHTAVHRSARRAGQRGITLLGMLMAAVVIGFVAVVAMGVIPSVNEYFTIKRAVDTIARSGATTVPEIRAAFEKQKEIEYSIKSITGKDLDISKENDQVVIRFAYDAQVTLMEPVYLLIKYQGRSK